MKRFVFAFVLAGLFTGCSSSDGNTPVEGSYDRTALMTSWADNIIIPSFEDYQAKADMLNTKAAAFAQAPSQELLDEVRIAWLDAYKAFQHVGIFDDQKAYELHLIEGSNTYPADVTGINANITSGSYTLSQPAQYAREGFPALDYLLFGVAEGDTAIVSYFTSNENARQYVADLAAHIKSVADAIVADWNGGYRETFIAGTGTAVSAAINQTVNNFVKNLEKDTRTPKLGIPAGLFSNGVTYADKVEGYYNNSISKQLLIEALTASRDFFNGKHFDMDTYGPGLSAYLDAVNAVRDGQNLSDVINIKYTDAFTAINLLNNSFSSQVTADNTKMVNAYNAVQQIVIAEKLDMLQALNISIDYVDGDGD